MTAEAHIVLSTVHVVLQLTESHLRLNHPELCQVPAGVTICKANHSFAKANTCDSSQVSPADVKLHQVSLMNLTLSCGTNIQSSADLKLCVHALSTVLVY